MKLECLLAERERFFTLCRGRCAHRVVVSLQYRGMTGTYLLLLLNCADSIFHAGSLAVCRRNSLPNRMTPSIKDSSNAVKKQAKLHD